MKLEETLEDEAGNSLDDLWAYMIADEEKCVSAQPAQVQEDNNREDGVTSSSERDGSQ